MKFIALLVFFFAALSANAQNLSVYGPEGRALLKISLGTASVGTSVAQASLSAFNQRANAGGFSYIGNANGIQEIAGLRPSVVSTHAHESRAYGWCFALNGQVAEAAPSAVRVSSARDEIVWFYGFVAQVHGIWQAGCRPDSAVQMILNQQRQMR